MFCLSRVDSGRVLKLENYEWYRLCVTPHIVSELEKLKKIARRLFHQSNAISNFFLQGSVFAVEGKQSQK